MTRTAKRLLKDIDGLAFPDRQQLLSARARALAGTPELDALLHDLHGQTENRRFARLLGLQLAYVARHDEHVERCLAGPETEVVRRALGAAVRLGLPGSAFVARLPGLPTALRRGLYESVRRRKATEIADALLPEVRTLFGDHEAAALLPACGPAVVAAALPDLGYAVTSWGMIGHRYPGVLLDHLDATLDNTPNAHWPHVWGRLGSGVGVAVLAEPDRVLALLARCAPHVPLPPSLSRTIGLLARRDPTRLLGVLLDPRRAGYVPGGRTLWRGLLGASDTELVGLGRVLARDGRLVSFLRVIPPGRRAAIYSGVLGERDLVASDVPVGVLDMLPAATRAAEASRLLGLRTVADDPRIRLQVTARLPWPRCRDTLLEATRRATADERAEAYPLFVKAAALSRDRDTFAEMLSRLERLRNEQDPVRLTAMRALADAPPWLFRPAETELVVRATKAAIEARDCSWLTQMAVGSLFRRLIREGAASAQPDLVEVGLSGLAVLGGNQRWLDLSGLDAALPRGAEHEVFAALRPRIEQDARRGRYEIALSLAAGLDQRAWPMTELQSYVDQARGARDDGTVRRAIELWLAPRATRSERLAEVLRADRSTITFPVVHNGIGRRRTDLLDEVFSKPQHGRFLKRGVRYLPPFADCYNRWLPRQVAEFARRLAALASGRTASWERVDAVRRLGRLPGTVADVRALLDNPSQPVADAALSALAWTDEPAEVLGELLAYADGDRAHIAVYAASRCARFVPPAQLGEALGPVLTGPKVTARKEAARLLAMHQAPEAAAALSRAWGGDQHRDVRRALVSASRWFLDDERAWELLERAAADEHAVATALLDLNPQTIAERHRGRYAVLVRAVASAADGDTGADTARIGLRAMPGWCRWDETGRELLVDVVTNLDATATWRAAISALLTDHAMTTDDEALLTVTRRLLDADEPTGADRDLPARQRLLAVAHAIRTATHQARRPAAANLAEVLAEVPNLRQVAVELAVTAVPLDEPGADLDRLGRLAELADRPIWAWHAHHALRTAVNQVVGRLPQDRLFEVAETLAGAPTAPAPQLLAVAIAEPAGGESGWPQRWRDLIGTLRRHENTDVRLAALDTFTSPE